MVVAKAIKKDIENKSKDELLALLGEYQKKLMVERAKLSSGISSENPSSIRNYKKAIARIKQLLSDKYNYKV